MSKTGFRVSVFSAIAVLLTLAVFQACSSNISKKSSTGRVAYKTSSYKSTPSKARAWEASMSRISTTQVSGRQLMQQVNVKQGLIKSGRYARRVKRPMNPKYITIHSTQNYSGDAWDHMRALQNGKLRGGTYGYLCWHFTVQEDVAIQHLPTNIRGEHSDFTGPGNTYSIGIEMCEHRGNDRGRTIDRTAKLAAALMYAHNIPLKNVVPHYHWPRYKYNPPHKNCPHFLLENGKPGATWAWFKRRVDAHYDRIDRGSGSRLAVMEDLTGAGATARLTAGQED